MCEFPVEPQMAKMLLASSGYKCVDEIISIAAMLSGTFSLSFCLSVHNFSNMLEIVLSLIFGSCLACVGCYSI